MSPSLQDILQRQLQVTLTVPPRPHELYWGLALATREALAARWLETQRSYQQHDVRQVCYLSMEYLLGRIMRSALQALRLEDDADRALAQYSSDLEAMEEEEWPSSLGSGGLGRLAACFLDSMATLELPAWGYGLRYRYGLFAQRIEDGQQRESPDDWLRDGYPWEIPRPEEGIVVSFYGHTHLREDPRDPDQHRFEWLHTEDVVAVPYDIPIPGYDTPTVNTLRLWAARPRGVPLDLARFKHGDHLGAQEALARAEALTAVLYPSEALPAGRELRLKQQYFLASATLQDLIRRHLANGGSLQNLAEKLVIQLNDTHPAIAIPELMRLLMDVHQLGWDDAWTITSATFAYTNHTLLPEALETWPLELLQHLLPRHVDIIKEIDRRFMDQAAQRLGPDDPRLPRLAIIGQHGHEPRVRMANLSVVASSSVNGVAALHTELLKSTVLSDFHHLYPERFNNKTNGITPRRWLLETNPRLAAFVTEHIGDGWIKDLDRLRDLEPLAQDPQALQTLQTIKRDNKRTLADYLRRRTGIDMDPDALVDAQIKRIHEYKRQLLLLLYTIHRYQRILADPQGEHLPRAVVISGKAAADYHRAKDIIRLIHGVAARINQDPAVAGRLRLIFVPNYGVTTAMRIVAGADLSEQISTAGYEASGTGNMKFALNGALTIGTLDGANVEIQEEVGPDNIFIFGLEAHEVTALRQRGYSPRDYHDRDLRLRTILDAITRGDFSPGQPDRYHSLVHDLLERDTYCLLADFAAYADAQDRVDRAYRDPQAWAKTALLNIARVGKFSSDRTIREYARDIWRVEPHPVTP